MPLRFKPLPPDARELLSKGLTEGSRLYRQRKPGHPMGREFSPDRIEMPMEIFSITVGELKAGAGLAQATLEGWRVFLEEGPPPRVAEVVNGHQGLVFLGISAGPQIDYIRLLLHELAGASEILRECAIRFFRVKPLNLAALWVVSSNTKNDILIALPPTHKPFVAGHRYTSEDFDQLLREAAHVKAPNAQIFFGKRKPL